VLDRRSSDEPAARGHPGHRVLGGGWTRRALTGRRTRRAVGGGRARRALDGGRPRRALTGSWSWRRRQLTAAPVERSGDVAESAEQRAAELYRRAVEQLDGDRATERLGGMLALERLAQDTPTHRQGVVDLLSAYLRTPYPLPAADSPAEPAGAVLPAGSGDQGAGSLAETPVPGDRPGEERSVRLTAQQILLAHLTRGPDLETLGGVGAEPAGAFWPEIRLDLTGATLVDFTVDPGQLTWATFDGATFRGPTRFDGVSFEGAVGFGGATFCADVRFDGAAFRGSAWFGGAAFDGEASFGGTTFDGTAWFDGASFRRNAWFDGATFRAAAGFDGAAFGADAGFGGAAFGGRAGFDQASFAGTVWFGGATVHGNAWFEGVTFCGEARFGGAVFHGKATFLGATHPDRVPGLSGVRVADRGRGHVWPPGFTVRPEPDGAAGGTVVRRVRRMTDPDGAVTGTDGEHRPAG